MITSGPTDIGALVDNSGQAHRCRRLDDLSPALGTETTRRLVIASVYLVGWGNGRRREGRRCHLVRIELRVIEPGSGHRTSAVSSTRAVPRAESVTRGDSVLGVVPVLRGEPVLKALAVPRAVPGCRLAGSCVGTAALWEVSRPKASRGSLNNGDLAEAERLVVALQDSLPAWFLFLGREKGRFGNRFVRDLVARTPVRSARL